MSRFVENQKKEKPNILMSVRFGSGTRTGIKDELFEERCVVERKWEAAEVGMSWIARNGDTHTVMCFF